MADTDSNVNLGLRHLTIEDILKQYGRRAFRGQVVISREDFNSPLDKRRGVILNDERIAASAENIRYLSDLGAKVVVLAHQGRAGKSDCIPLEQHAKILSEYVRKPVTYRFGCLFGISAQETIRSLRPGGIFVVDNTRFLAEEDIKDATPPDYNGTNFIRTLESLANFYVNDAFSVSHRAHASVVGFVNVPNLAGRLMDSEIRENMTAIQNIQSPYVLILGGLKIDDYFDLMVTSLETDKVSHVLISGALGILAVMKHKSNPTGIDVGEQTVQFLKKEKIWNLRHKVAGLIGEYANSFVLPEDFVVEIGGKVEVLTVEQIGADARRNEFGIYDIGPRTREKYAKVIKEAKTVYLKGPAGLYEREEFREGSRALLLAMNESGAYTIAGGGDTKTMVTLCGLDPKKFGRFSLSGGAFIEYLAGRTILPGLVSLNTTFNAFHHLDLRTGIPPPYKLGYELKAPVFAGKT